MIRMPFRLIEYHVSKPRASGDDPNPTEFIVYGNT